MKREYDQLDQVNTIFRYNGYIWSAGAPGKEGRITYACTKPCGCHCVRVARVVEGLLSALLSMLEKPGQAYMEVSPFCNHDACPPLMWRYNAAYDRFQSSVDNGISWTTMARVRLHRLYRIMVWMDPGMYIAVGSKGSVEYERD